MRIGIVGCGIAGQAAAIALARDGHDVTLVERFAEAKPVGAGLLLQPSGQTALARLGLLEAARGWGAPIERLYGRTVGGRMVMDLRYGDLESGAHGLGIHRAALFQVLHDAFLTSGARLLLDYDVIGIEDFAAPRLVARDGRVEGPFDLVLDCAGANDALRSTFGVRLRASLYSWGALWTICRDPDGAFETQLRQVYDGAHLMIGILPIGRAPGAPPGERYLSFFWSLPLSEYQKQRDAGLAALKTRVLEAWPEAAPIVNEITDFGALSLATYHGIHMDPPYKGRVLAIADAAHGTSPQLGQGANLALIDALVLAHALRREHDVGAALARYSSLRGAHLSFYRIGSAALTPAFQSNSRALGWARDAFLGPMGKVPGLKHVMRTTLAGTRKFPFGLFKMPEG